MIDKAFTGETITFEGWLEIPHLGRRFIYTSYFPLFDEQKKNVVGIVLKAQDQTEHKKLETQLQQAQKMDAIGQLAGGIAHDFNNMLGGIMGAGEMLSLYLPDDPKAKKFHQVILQSASRAADLTSKLLTFSRDTNKASSAINVHDIIQETVVLLENTIDRRIRIETNLNAKSSTIIGDPSQLQNIFLNLAINASHAMPEGGIINIASQTIDLDSVYCNISTFDLQPGRYLEIEIRDSGYGIPFEHLTKIFEPFFTTKDQGKGTGLGLSAVYGTVKQHFGSITVYSEIGVGTKFHILFPLNEKEALIMQSTQALQRGSGTILLVDDEEVMQITAKAILEDLGYKIILAKNGLEALSIFKEKADSIDLIILDMIMPVMNGKDCFLAIKKHTPQAKVILSSGFTREEDLKEMKSHGLKGFIRKPYRSAPLSQAVYDALT